MIMPLYPSYPSSASAPRPRRPRDRDNHREKDGRSANSSSSSRRHKELSRSSTRTPPRPLRPAQPSLYHQGENFTLEQLHPFPGPESGVVTPSASPPVPSVTSALPSPASSLMLPAHHQSPAGSLILPARHQSPAISLVLPAHHQSPASSLISPAQHHSPASSLILPTHHQSTANSLMLTGHHHLETPLALQPYLDHDDDDDDDDEDEDQEEDEDKEEEEPTFTNIPESRNTEEREISSTKSTSPKSIGKSPESKSISPKQINQKLELNSPTAPSQNSEPPTASPASINDISENHNLESLPPIAFNHEKSESVSTRVASLKSEPASPIVADSSKQTSPEVIDRSLDATPPQAVNQLLDMTPSRVVNQTLDIASPRPVNQPSESKLVKQALEQPSPRLINQHLESVAIISQSTPSPGPVQTALYRSPASPAPSGPSPFWGHPPPAAGVYDPNQRFSQPLLYVSNPPQFAPPPPVPYFPGHPAEHFYSPQYCGPPYMPLPQHSTNPTELQSAPPPNPPFFTNYPPHPPPQQIQPPFHPIHDLSIRGNSPTGSRRSFSEEQQYSTLHVPQHPGNPAENTLPPESFDQEREDDPGNLLQRLQSALPDLHLLLNKYQETSNRAEFRKSQIRENEAHRAAQLKQKENYIERLGRELESASSKHAAESNRLRRELGDMEEKQKDLEDDLWAEKKATDELEAANRALRLEKEISEVRLTEEKNGMARDVNYWRERESEEEARIKALEAELEHQRQEREAQIAVLKKQHAKEKEELQSGWTKQRREIDDGNMRIKQDLEASLEAQQKANEEEYRKHMQDLESWNKERESMSVRWDEERTMLGKGWEEQRKVLGAKHQTEKDEMLKKWQASQSRANKSAEEENLRLQKEIEKLRAGWDADKAKFAKVTAEMRSAATKLNEENVKLQKLVEAFGEVTDLKSREDPFYDDAFHHLYKQISDLTSDHFRDAIDEPPEEIIKSIPPTIPPFFSSTDSSIKLRAAYVEHLISTIISRRVFQPFLFTISLRHGNPDLLFQSMSDHLRKKSTRREALWRQRTLHAAYTISSAKQSINKIAAYIVDEVVDAIKYFTNHHRWEQVTVAVRRIIKTAAETWRYARLEVAMITASATADDRPDFQRASNLLETSANGPNVPDQQRQLLLSLFPIIEREAIHEDIREEKHPGAQGYIYFPGRMLYSDDPIIVKRLEEIHVDEMRLAGKEVPRSHDDNRVKDQVDADGENYQVTEGNENMRQFNANEGSPFPKNGAGPTPPRSPNRNRSGSESRVSVNMPLCTTPANDISNWIGGDRSSTEFELSPNASSISSPRRQLLRRDSSAKRKYSSGSHSSGGRSASTSDATRSSSTTLGPSAMPSSWGGSLGNGGIAFPRAGPDRWAR